MSQFSITGDDTLILNDRVILDLADADSSTITFPNDLTTQKTGKDGNTLFAKNETGRNIEMVLRILRGSNDDKFLNSLLAKMKNDFTGFVLINGTFVKKVGDGKGAVTNDTYEIIGGAFKREVDAKENVEGDTEQAVSVYTLLFSRANRILA